VVVIRMDNRPDHDEQLRKLSNEGVCPNCGGKLKPGSRYPHGAGVFCGLRCLGDYKGAELIEQHRRILAAFERHRRS
jgi:hypothetical protein